MSNNNFVAKLAAAVCGLSMIAAATSAENKNNDEQIEEIVIFGRDSHLLGSAESASQGSVSGADLLVRPMLKVAELLESMPGMIAVQHSGSGKANQYFLRGFNLDHGTDYTSYVDGMPWNLRSHGHGQGYLDVNGLIPESVESIAYKKGPYFADLGDFSLAGASFIHTVDRLDENFISIENGEYGWNRLAAGTSTQLSRGTLTLMGDIKHYDGPWEQREELQHRALWGKYIWPTPLGEAEITLSAYQGKWLPTEQIPERVIGSTVCKDRFCTLDNSAEGKTIRYILTGQVTGHDWQASAYGQYYDWQMESNPTYDYQLHQFDQRHTLGGQVNKSLLNNNFIELDMGTEFRYDNIGSVGLSHYQDGQFVGEISDNAITETSAALYINTTWYLADSWRLFAGLREDYYRFDVHANNAASFEGKQNNTLLSPKVGLAYELNEYTELYANWGKGFHSNDARGVVSNSDPVPGLSAGTGHELGARFAVDDIKFTATYWWLNQDSELIFVGDANSVEPKGGSKREGIELTLFWQPLKGIGIDGVYTNSQARYTTNPEGRYIENAIEQAAQLGIAITQEDWDLSARLRYRGDYALTADNQQRAKPLTTVNLRGAYRFSHLMLYAELTNIFNKTGEDITYYYSAYVAGFDPSNLTAEDIDCSRVNCTMSRATEPRTVRFGIRYTF